MDIYPTNISAGFRLKGRGQSFWVLGVVLSGLLVVGAPAQSDRRGAADSKPEFKFKPRLSRGNVIYSLGALRDVDVDKGNLIFETDRGLLIIPGREVPANIVKEYEADVWKILASKPKPAASNPVGLIRGKVVSSTPRGLLIQCDVDHYKPNFGVGEAAAQRAIDFTRQEWGDILMIAADGKLKPIEGNFPPIKGLILLVGHPNQDSFADDDKINVVAGRTEELFNYTSTAGAAKRVRVYDMTALK